MPGRQTPAISPADSAFFIRKHFRPRHQTISISMTIFTLSQAVAR